LSEPPETLKVKANRQEILMKPHAVSPSDLHAASEPLDADLHAQAPSATQRLHAVVGRSKEAARQLRHHYDDAQHRTELRVRRHPLQSVAVAMGVGVMLGVILDRLSGPRRPFSHHLPVSPLN
jgi:ElaB/YqjD/DUF883 family membrane-anchored ribosome-binding protein